MGSIRKHNLNPLTATSFSINGSFVSSMGDAGNHFLFSSDNLFIGHRAGTSNITGSGDTFLGALAGNANTTGTNNVFVGHNAGTSNTVGACNVFMGKDSGVNVSTGDDNVFVGHSSGSTCITGTKNTILGAWSDVDSSSRTGAIVLGSGVTSFPASNSLTIPMSIGGDSQGGVDVTMGQASLLNHNNNSTGRVVGSETMTLYIRTNASGGCQNSIMTSNFWPVRVASANTTSPPTIAGGLGISCEHSFTGSYTFFFWNDTGSPLLIADVNANAGDPGTSVFRVVELPPYTTAPTGLIGIDFAVRDTVGNPSNADVSHTLIIKKA